MSNKAKEDKLELLTSDSDAWDDSALIKAWDETINSFKEGMQKYGLDNNSNPTKTSRKKKKSRKCKPFSKLWSVGDECEALYEDGYFYNAKIVSINDENVKILYTDYDDIGEVLHSQIRRCIKLNSEKDGSYEIGSSHYNDVFVNTIPYLNAFSFGEDFYKCLPQPHHPPVPPPPCPLHHQPSILNNMPHSHTTPPKPPCPNSVPQVCSDEALAAVLMSWYKTGYNTGYYQALRDHQLPFPEKTL